MDYAVYAIGLCTLLQGWLLLTKERGFVRLCRNNLILRGRKAKGKAFSFAGALKEKEWVKRRREEKINEEIYASISFLRNITALGRGRKVSADFIIEQLSLREGVLQPVYIKMLASLRIGRKEGALELFAKEAPTMIGKEFGGLLLQWDDMDPAELTEILISHQKNIKEVKLTIQKKRDEMVSDLIYIPVVVNVFLIFVNFIYVAYFMEQQEMLRMLF